MRVFVAIGKERATVPTQDITITGNDGIMAAVESHVIADCVSLHHFDISCKPSIVLPICSILSIQIYFAISGFDSVAFRSVSTASLFEMRFEAS